MVERERVPRCGFWTCSVFFCPFFSRLSNKKASQMEPQNGPNSLKTGSECVVEHPKRSRIICGKNVFPTIFDPFLAPKWSIRRPCGAKRCPKTAHKTVSKTAQKRVFEHPKWSRVIFGEKPLNFGHFQTHFGPMRGRFGGCFVAVLGPNDTIYGRKNRQNMTKR